MKAFKRIIFFELLTIVVLTGLIFTSFYQVPLNYLAFKDIIVVLALMSTMPGSFRPPFLSYILKRNSNFIFPTDRYQSFRKALHYLILLLFSYCIVRTVANYFNLAIIPLFLIGYLILLIIERMFIEGKESTFDFIELDDESMFISTADYTKGYELIFTRDSEHVQIEEDEIVVLANRKRFTKLGQIMHDGEEKMEISIPFCFLKESDVLSLKEYLKKEAV